MTAPDPTDPGSDGRGELCSRASARRGLPLIGSAGCYDAVLAFELGSPWAARLVGSRASDPVLDETIANISVSRPGLRLLALEPREAGGPDSSPSRPARVLFLQRTGGGFREYARREFVVAREELADCLARCAAGDAPGSGEVPVAEGLRDLLVCNHGSRDACCGKFGYGLFQEMDRLAAMRADLRVWRCSHLGGHRFAPTMLDLPSGRMFGRLADGDAAAVLDGGPPLLRRIESIYRGRCALPEPAQIVERELWLRGGAALEEAELRWEVERDEAGAGGEGPAWAVRLDAAGLPAVEATVVRLDAAAVRTPASCGRDPESESPWKMTA